MYAYFKIRRKQNYNNNDKFQAALKCTNFKQFICNYKKLYFLNHSAKH